MAQHAPQLLLLHARHLLLLLLHVCGAGRNAVRLCQHLSLQVRRAGGPDHTPRPLHGRGLEGGLRLQQLQQAPTPEWGGPRRRRRLQELRCL